MDLSIIILIDIVCGIAAFLIAQNRGASSAPGWGVLGFIFGPLGLLVTAVGAKGSRPVGGAGVGAADELAKLADIRDRGILTPEEFELQKAALLAKGAPAKQAMTGPGKFVFWGIIATLVVAIAWMAIQII